MPAWTNGIENEESMINLARMTGIWNEITLKEGIGSTPNPQFVFSFLFPLFTNRIKDQDLEPSNLKIQDPVI